MSERVLTVKQPWADLIMGGVKDVENRSWSVPSTLPHWWRCVDGPVDGEPYWMPEHEGQVGACDKPVGQFPFRLWIHAGKQPDREMVERWASLWAGPRTEHPLGVLLGTVTVTDCHHADECYLPDGMHDTLVGPQYHAEEWCSRWAEPDVYHWTLTGPEPLDVPVPMRGRQGLWTLDREVVPA